MLQQRSKISLIRMSLSLICLSLISLGAACVVLPSPAAARPGDLRAPPSTPALPTMSRSAPPASVQLLMPLLRARHSTQLPSGERLAAIEGVTEGLLWLGRFGNPVSLRVRALNGLRAFPSPEARELFRWTEARRRSPKSLRAAALRGLGGYLTPLSEEIVELFRRALHAPDRRVRGAATEVVESSAPLARRLQRPQPDHSLVPAPSSL